LRFGQSSFSRNVAGCQGGKELLNANQAQVLVLSFGLAVAASSGLPREPKRIGEPVNLATQDSSPGAQTAEKKEKKDSQPEEKATKTSGNQTGSTNALDRLVYHIGVEDELQISVWREPELSTNVVVRPDGMITLPLLGDLKAVGLKTDELQALLVEKLKGFLNEPQVTVIVRAIHSRKVHLVGEVARQGTYPINGDMTALELLAIAGGLGPFAKGDSIYILREKDGKKIRIPFKFKKAVEGKSEDVVLYPGDVVVVP
jgi:polysaccharide export outer membrane protein